MKFPCWQLLAAAILAAPAQATQIYKCTLDGAVAYQDKPCTEGEQSKVEVTGTPRRAGTRPSAKTSAGAGTATTARNSNVPARLFTQITEFNALLASLHTEIDQQVKLADARARAEFGSRDDQASRNARTRYIREAVQPLQEQLEALQARSDSLMEELKRRCPGGASFSPPRQECRQAPAK